MVVLFIFAKLKCISSVVQCERHDSLIKLDIRVAIYNHIRLHDMFHELRCQNIKCKLWVGCVDLELLVELCIFCLNRVSVDVEQIGGTVYDTGEKSLLLARIPALVDADITI